MLAASHIPLQWRSSSLANGVCVCVCILVSRMQLTHEEVCKLRLRLAHWTFVMRGEITLHLHRLRGTTAAEQPAILRTQLQLLHDFRWRFEPGASVKVALHDWRLSNEFMAELQGLPTLPADMCLLLDTCRWREKSGEPCGDYTDLVAHIPACYNTVWVVSDDHGSKYYTYRGQDVVDVCRGAKARGWGCERLTVKCQFSLFDQPLVDACVEEHGLGPYVAEVQWTKNHSVYRRSDNWRMWNSDSEGSPKPRLSTYDIYDRYNRADTYGSPEYGSPRYGSPEHSFHDEDPYESPEPRMSEGGQSMSESASEPRSEDRYERRYARMSPTWSDEGSFQSDD